VAEDVLTCAGLAEPDHTQTPSMHDETRQKPASTFCSDGQFRFWFAMFHFAVRPLGGYLNILVGLGCARRSIVPMTNIAPQCPQCAGPTAFAGRISLPPKIIWHCQSCGHEMWAQVDDGGGQQQQQIQPDKPEPN